MQALVALHLIFVAENCKKQPQPTQVAGRTLSFSPVVLSVDSY
jgi:hypothetical protein